MKKSNKQTNSPDIDLLKAQAETDGILFLSEIDDSILAPELVDKLSFDWARTNKMLPVIIDQEKCVLMSDLASVNEQEYLELLLGEDLTPVVAPVDLITEAIEHCYYQRDNSAKEFIRDIEESSGSTVQVAKSDLLEDATNAPVTQLVNLILLGAVKQGASDIHFEPFESHLRVRYRIDGVLYEQSLPPKHLELSLVSRLKVMAHMDIAEKRLPQDGMANVRVGDREIDIRVSTIPVAEGERVVLRLLDRDSALLPLVDLGMDESALVGFDKLLELSNGIILVSGPTGSGKTTTLYAGLEKLDASRRNILTIEDPIEYRLSNIGQIQVKPKIGLTFASGLRHILRQDPDVILVGETRDRETAEIAIRASLTGHLVFTTLHTNDAPSAVLRLVDMGIESCLIASTLKGVLAQRLVRKLCSKCKKETVVTDALIERNPDLTGLLTVGQKIWEPHGCPDCKEGYRGRVGVFELMLVNEEMRDMVRTGNITSGVLIDAAERAGMVSLFADGVHKATKGLTSIDEVLGTLLK
ncbi:MAG: type II/IV secretion system protein [Kiritimatiellae bacterium]|nr:type II/IV secretion system protein [Kiritimatiellia bacterium]